MNSGVIRTCYSPVTCPVQAQVNGKNCVCSQKTRCVSSRETHAVGGTISFESVFLTEEMDCSAEIGKGETGG